MGFDCCVLIVRIQNANPDIRNHVSGSAAPIFRVKQQRIVGAVIAEKDQTGQNGDKQLIGGLFQVRFKKGAQFIVLLVKAIPVLREKLAGGIPICGRDFSILHGHPFRIIVAVLLEDMQNFPIGFQEVPIRC